MPRIIISIFVFFILSGCSRQFVSEEKHREVENLIQSYNSSNWETRRDAISRVCLHEHNKVEGLLLTALDDTHSAVKIEALNCIAIRRPNKAKKRIRQIAESENDLNIRLYAIRTLGKYHDATAAPIFARGLSSDDWLIREESIKGLLMIEDFFIRQISIPYILQALDDTRINVRLTTIEYLKVRNEKIYIKLSNIINDEENLNKIDLIKAALKAMDGYLLDDSTRERIIDLLTHTNTEIRILSLGILKTDKRLQDLQQKID